MNEISKFLVLTVWGSLFLLTGWIVLSYNDGWSLLQSGDTSERTLVLGRLVGLYLFYFLNLQIFMGAWMRPLMKVWRGFFNLHIWNGIFTYLLTLSHPALIYLTVSLQVGYFNPMGVYDFGSGVLFGQIGFLVLTTTVLAGLFRRRIGRHWQKIHWANYFLWVIIFFHSRAVGTDTHNPWANALFGIYLLNLISGALFRFLPRINLAKRGATNGITN